jgi:hypothetical protein
VGTDLLTIDIDSGKIVYRTEVQEDPLPCFVHAPDPTGRQDHFPAIPNAGHEILKTNAGQITFRAERNGDLSG